MHPEQVLLDAQHDRSVVEPDVTVPGALTNVDRWRVTYVCGFIACTFERVHLLIHAG
jgi:hypothetical protein